MLLMAIGTLVALGKRSMSHAPAAKLVAFSEVTCPLILRKNEAPAG
jgi:hypothetical protein